MKLFLICQKKISGYDTYDSAVVAALSEDDARNMHPNGGNLKTDNDEWGSWVSIDYMHHVKVEYLGETEIDRGVICASFNAG